MVRFVLLTCAAFELLRQRTIWYLRLLLPASIIAYCLCRSFWQTLEFPKIACYDHSLRQDPAQGGTGNVIRNLGNWSFEEPSLLASVCRGTGSETPPQRTLLAIVPVTSGMLSSRTDLRRTWGAELNKNFGQLLFLIQLRSGLPLSRNLAREREMHQDILIAYHSGADSFDSYDFLVRKIIAGLQWYSQHCQQGFDFVLKADHDSYWNIASLVRLLRRHQPSEPLVFGSVQENAPVSRDSASKFFLSKEQYAGDRFPPYASGGPGYAMSRSAVLAIAREAELQVRRIGALWLEDVYLTGILPTLYYAGNRSGVARFYHIHSDHVFVCRYLDFSANTVKLWPPLAMHRVKGWRLGALHAWTLSGAETAWKAHQIVYSRLLN